MSGVRTASGGRYASTQFGFHHDPPGFQHPGVGMPSRYVGPPGALGPLGKAGLGQGGKTGSGFSTAGYAAASLGAAALGGTLVGWLASDGKPRGALTGGLFTAGLTAVGDSMLFAREKNTSAAVILFTAGLGSLTWSLARFAAKRPGGAR